MCRVWLGIPMTVLVAMMIEVRGEVGDRLVMRVVVVVVLVDNHGGSIREHHPPTECLSEQLGDEDVLGTTVGKHAARHEHDTIGS